VQRRTRTTKKLAQRIDLHYFKYPHPLRRWRWWLSLGATLLAVIWIAWGALAGDEEIYSSGDVSEPHAVIGQQCGVCHLEQPKTFREHVTNEACEKCHAGPIHSLREVQEDVPTCGVCHVEHKGEKRLAEVDDKNCAACHANLRVHTGEPEVARSIRSLQDHAKLGLLVANKKDPGTIKLNHEVHLRKGLRGPQGQVQLECVDCHRTAAVREPWPYGEAQFRKVTTPKEGEPRLGPKAERALYSAPVKYSQACAWCHPLYFDKRIADAAPHDKPEIVQAFMVKKFQEHLAKNPGAWREVEAPERRIPGKPYEVKAAARSPQEWLTQRIADAENMLWSKTCKECHSLSFALTKTVSASFPAGKTVPEVAKANMTTRWLGNAEFDHEPHKMMECSACHAAPNSKETSDVLLPKIETCIQCHAPGKAESRCFECHAYHDWSKETWVKGRYSLPQLLRTPPPAKSSGQ